MTEKRVTIDDLAATTENALDRIEAKMATKEDLELLEERFRDSGDHEERLQRLEHTVFSTRNKRGQ